jgi:hypothetical protein
MNSAPFIDSSPTLNLRFLAEMDCRRFWQERLGLDRNQD